MRPLVKHINNISDRVNQFLPISGDDTINVNSRPNSGTVIGLPPQTNPRIWHLAIIKSAGPASEANYTNNNYWVKYAFLKQGNSDTFTSVAVPTEEDDGSRTFTATNMAESVLGTHLLKTGDFVWVTAVRGRSTSGKTFLQYLIWALPVATAMARVISVSGSFPAWSYTCQLVTSRNGSLTTASQWVTGGTVGQFTATNRMEFSGTPTYTYGNGAPITSSSGQVNSTACVIKAIGVGATVDVTTAYDSNSSTSCFSFAQGNIAY